ncbi:fibro-slime domain-containing protein [Nannocystis sp. ILAH1]|uniref:fibro-slime domain-containing protein n=1 Tax=Nannocystis sp. ILAH1 TaxID=2996789 RepID=UPI00226DB9D7|nr:fibro-slime domain-containing protein [Nannocystis sp. ILAH1]MCY0986341.1 fibro-slime domain-containing protein [Nannocystis sp. ILAH1]
MSISIACGTPAPQGNGTDSDAGTESTASTDGTATTDDPTAGTGSESDGTDSGTASGTESTTTTTTAPTSTTDPSATDTDTATATSTPVTSSTTTEGETTTQGETTEGETTEGETTEGETTTTTTDTTDTTTTSTTGEPPLECGNLPVIYRDMKPLHSDFGCHMWGNGVRPTLVQPMLGGDGKPVYNPQPGPTLPGYGGSNPQITSAASFSDWYNTKDGINVEIAGELELTEIQQGIWSFESDEFFPLTGQGFGNNVTENWAGETYPNHNGSFTTEIHTNFVYEAGQTFSFSGDDDVWIFIDGKLAMDIGGLHPPAMGTIELDLLGLTVGETYSLDAFHAERCEAGSNFRIDTSINCFIPM